jgi:glycosyltransferase involved in cell wall biosynthesis
MDEPQVISFIERLASQTQLPHTVAVCVNHPKTFWNSKDKRNIAETNIETLRKLQKSADNLPFALKIIDCCTVGTDEKHIGVGWARKYALDFINTIAAPDDIMFWMDADTVYPDNYIEEVLKVFEYDTQILALTVPYYHLIDGFDSRQQIAALRYEIYMRSYLINLYRIKHPYTFTAIGSGIVSTVGAYRKAGGLTPVKSGEDFYFIQKLFKIGKVSAWCNVVCNPSIRASNRVFFGTGPAIRKGLVNDWESYPVYPFSLFEEIGNIYKKIGGLRLPDNVAESINVISEADICKFRANSRTREQFIKFCTEKFDALRTLQYLKSHYKQDDSTDADNLRELLTWCGQPQLGEFPGLSVITLPQWLQIREVLFGVEMLFRGGKVGLIIC